MEFRVNKTDLVRELSVSQGVVEKKTTIPILSNVLLEAEGGRIHLLATDLELSVRCSCPAEVTKPGAGTVPMRRLLDYVRLLPDAPIDIKFSDNHWASLVSGRSRTRIAGMSKESFPELPVAPPPIAAIPSGVLTELILRTIFVISLEESRFTLNGALLLLKPDRVVMVSTDGHRLALCERPADLGGVIDYRSIVPKKAMVEVLKLAQEAGPEAAVDFSADENHLFFRFGTRLFVCRKLTGNFPDYERVLPGEQPHSIILQREEFRAMIDRVGQFSDERSHAVRVKFTPGELKLFASLSDTGESEEVLPVNYDGPVLEAGYNAQYISEFLRAADEESVAFHFRDAGSAGEFRPIGGEGGQVYRYVVMPMRI
mgnify:CR=1 FL=1